MCAEPLEDSLILIPDKVKNILTLNPNFSLLLHKVPISRLIKDLELGNSSQPCVQALIETVLNKLPFPVPFIKLYVDDTILAVSKSHIHLVLDRFNKYHKVILTVYG